MRLTIPILLWLAFMAGCAARSNNKAAGTLGTVGTLADLHKVRPDVQDFQVEVVV